MFDYCQTELIDHSATKNIYFTEFQDFSKISLKSFQNYKKKKKK